MRGGREKPFIDLPFGWLMTKPKQEALHIRRAVQGDRAEWLRMRAALWSDETNKRHREEMDEYLRENAAVAYVAARPSGGLAGFVEATIRPHADACDTSPVGYVEGWYVDADVRRRGVGRRLVRTAERWACGSPRQRGQPSGAPRHRVRRAGAADPFSTMAGPPRGPASVVEDGHRGSVLVTTLRGMRGPRVRVLGMASGRSQAAGSGHTAVRAGVPPTR